MNIIEIIILASFCHLWLYYSRVRNKHTLMVINFLTFFQGLQPYSGLHSAYFRIISIRYKWGYAYSFLLNFPGATFIQGATFIPNSRVHDSTFNLTKVYMQLETPQQQISNVYTNLFQVDCQNYIRVLVQLDSRHPEGKEELLVCGTNAYNPMCRHYLTDVSTNNNKKNDRSLVQKEFSGRGFCPYDPRHNSTSIYAGT